MRVENVSDPVYAPNSKGGPKADGQRYPQLEVWDASGEFVRAALMALVIAAGGLYGAWMYEPGFRTFAQPQIDRVAALAGMALPQNRAPQTQKPTAQPVPTPAPAPAPVVAETTSAADLASLRPHSTHPTTTESSSNGGPVSSATASVAPQPVAPPPSAVAPPSSQATPAAAPVVSRIDLSKTASSKPAESKKSHVPAPALDTPLPGEKRDHSLVQGRGKTAGAQHSRRNIPPKRGPVQRKERSFSRKWWTRTARLTVCAWSRAMPPWQPPPCKP